MPAVAYVHTSSSLPVGHYTIEINDFGGGPFSSQSDYHGYYPNNPSGNLVDFFDGPGMVLDDEVRTIGEKNNLDHNVSSPVPLTANELQQMRDYVNDVANNPGDYDFNGDSFPSEGRNCVDFVYEAFEAAGIALNEVFSDSELIDAGLAGYYADQEYGDGSIGEVALPLIIPGLLGSLSPAHAAGAIAAAAAAFGDALFSPLIFDLGGNGLDLSPLDGSPIFYDLDADEFAENAGWVDADDGFLVTDLNSNGVIDSQVEMFGEDATGSAWDKLAVYDTDGNGTIEGAERTPLNIWRDLNQNGVSEGNELFSLADAGVESINLTNTNDWFTVAGHQIDGGGNWTKSGGGIEDYYDVFFNIDQQNSWYVGADTSTSPLVEIETLFLPLSRGYGTIKSLHLAMTEDSALKDKVAVLASSSSYSTLNQDVQDILFDWAGVDGIDPATRGDYIDGRLLGFVESMVDQPFRAMTFLLNEVDDPYHPELASPIMGVWSIAFDELKTRILAQSTFAGVLGEVSYDFATDVLSFADSLTDILTRAETGAPTDPLEAEWYWRELGHILTQNHGAFGQTEAQVKTALDTTAGESVTLFDAYLFDTPLDDEFVGSDLNDSMIAGDGDDDLILYEGDDYAEGGLGNDTLNGEEGDDTLLGGDGDDDLQGRDGDDLLIGGAGNDDLLGDRFVAGNDTLLGGDGDDDLSGKWGNDSLDGGDGNDWLHGGDDSDTLIGGTGKDTLDGGDGADIIKFSDLTHSVGTGGQRDRITDFEVGIDKIDLSGLGFTALTTNGSTQADEIRVFNDGVGRTFIRNDQTDFEFDFSANILSTLSEADFIFTAPPATLTGSAGNDTLTGTAGADSIEGFGGDDTLAGLVGSDTLDGGAGLDTADYTSSDAAVMVQLWNGSASGGHAEGDTLISIENLIGSAYDDFLVGNAAPSNHLNGQDGNDTIVGGNNAGTLLGGNGNDWLSAHAGAHTMDGGAGVDTANYQGSTSGVNVQLWNGTSTGGYAEGDTLISIENLVGSNFADTLVGNASANRIEGHGGNDTLNAGQNVGTVLGGDGNDWLVAHAGVHTMDGGAGVDTVSYQASTSGVEVQLWNGTSTGGYAEGDTLISIENLVGSNFADTLVGNASANRIEGHGGNDTLNGGQNVGALLGGSDDDLLRGHVGAHTMDGGTGNDTADYSLSTAGVDVQLWNNTALGGYAAGDSFISIENLIGSAYADNLVGTGYANRIEGRDGDDSLNGGQNNDTLVGGNGNDLIRGHDGADELTGNSGNDVFIYYLAQESTAAATDRITDFQNGQDLFHLAALGLSGFGDLSVTFDNGSGEDRTYVADTTGSGFTFYITGNHIAALDASDFVF